jgi:hypothetical protein
VISRRAFVAGTLAGLAGARAEQPTRFELVLTAQTARALGLAIPPAVTLRVDELIDR